MASTVDGILTTLAAFIANHDGLPGFNTSNVIVSADLDFPQPMHHDIMCLVAHGSESQPHADAGDPYTEMQVDVAVISKVRLDAWPSGAQSLTHDDYGSIDIAEDLRAKLTHSFLEGEIISPMICLGLQPPKRYGVIVPDGYTMAIMRFTLGFDLGIPRIQVDTDDTTEDRG
jgi:hypothetical protein